MSQIGIVAFTALGWERRSVLAALREVRPADVPRRWVGRLDDGRTCLVVQTGMGAARAQAAALDAPPADAFLSVGCGGGLLPWLRTGDVVVATEVVLLDRSCRPAAHAAAVLPRVELGAHAGRIASSVTVLTTIAEKTAAAGSGALLVDMESWTLAMEAERRDVPFTALRVVLDGAQDELPGLVEAVDASTGDLDAWRVARALLPRPWTWPTAIRLARQQGEAAERLTETVSALLHAPTGLGRSGAPAVARS